MAGTLPLRALTPLIDGPMPWYFGENNINRQRANIWLAGHKLEWKYELQGALANPDPHIRAAAATAAGRRREVGSSSSSRRLSTIPIHASAAQQQVLC